MLYLHLLSLPGALLVIFWSPTVLIGYASNFFFYLTQVNTVYCFNWMLEIAVAQYLLEHFYTLPFRGMLRNELTCGSVVKMKKDHRF